MHIGNDDMCVQNKFGLRKGQLATIKQERTERTVKT